LKFLGRAKHGTPLVVVFQEDVCQSFRNLARDFPDQWYELNNPDPIDPDPSVTINLAASAFPHGLEQLSTTAVAIGLTPASSPLPEARVTLRRTISDATAGGDTDTSRDYEYTDWKDLREFTDRFARLVAAAPAMSA